MSVNVQKEHSKGQMYPFHVSSLGSEDREDVSFRHDG